MSFSNEERQRALQKMHQEIFDLVIVGGGITGAGVARDATSRGMKVALIEARDFASGTSSRSSKLIHGGIRYLENFEFGLVFEALSERQRLFDMAPHLVHPLQFLIPLYKGGRVPPWKMGLGMWAYDALSLFEAPQLHSHLSPREIQAEFPAIQQKDLLGAYSYCDAYMDDDRLVFETLRSAHRGGATCANYVASHRAEITDGKVTALICEDLHSFKNFKLRGRHFVGSVGPWTDILGQEIFHEWKKVLRPSKGVHLTFLRERLPLPQAVVMAAESRIVFGIPRHEMVIIGTTDTDYSGDPANVTTTREDVDYLLRVANQYFPGAQLTEKDIVASYAGVRPLVDDGSQTESKTSREHMIWTDARNITFVAGGKYTTYRNMAEQTVDEVLAHGPIEERIRFGRPQTVAPLNPLVTKELWERSRNEISNIAARSRVSNEVVGALVERHGLEAESILERGLPRLRSQESIRTDEELLWSLEALHAIHETMCLSLTDFYFRRTPLILARRDHGRPLLKALAEAMGAVLKWSSAEREEQINAVQKQLDHELGWKLTHSS